MLKNHLLVALRIMRRQKVFSFINIFGLSVGLACCLMILLFVRDETSFENFHANGARIYRTIIDEFVNGTWEHNVGSPDLLGPALAAEYPEVMSYVRLFNPRWIDKWTVSKGEEYFYEKGLFFADPTIFEIFTFPLIRGNPETALRDPHSLVITESAARKYFGDEDPMGKALVIQDTVEVRVTGVAGDIPPNTHFRFDFLASFQSMPYKWAMNTWRTQQFYTYVLMDREYSRVQLEQKLSTFVKKHFGKQTKMALGLQPIEDIHLRSRNYNQDMAANNGDISYVYIFSTIAFFILAIACFNFMNLSTARSAARAKEVGMRKVMGAGKGQLIRQFLAEAMLCSLLAALLSIVLILLFLPKFNSLTGKNIVLTAGNFLFIEGTLATLFLITGIASGSYPAFFLSGFLPLNVLKGGFSTGKKGMLFRRVLVFFQFTISIALIIGTLIVHGQIRYCLNKNLGLEKERVVVLPLMSSAVMARQRALRTALLQQPSVVNIAGSVEVPGGSIGSRGILPEGNQWYPRNSMLVDHEFIPALGLEIVEGRNFSRDFATDLEDAYIVNEAAVQNFGWDEPVGKKIIWAGDKNKKGYVIGVVRDFHYASFHEEISPLILHMSAGAPRYLSIRLKGNNIPGTLSFLRGTWREFYPGHPFEYFFLDESYDSLYRTEEKMGTLFRIFTVLGLFISCLGLYGLSSYLLAQRTKEIAIRKVLGASTPKILFLVSKEFVRWVLLANVVAWPVIFFAMKGWLENFAYRINIPVSVFLLSAAIVFGIAVLTIGYQSAKAALSNPADFLRYE